MDPPTYGGRYTIAGQQEPLFERIGETKSQPQMVHVLEQTIPQVLLASWVIALFDSCWSMVKL